MGLATCTQDSCIASLFMPYILYACVCEKNLAVLNVPQCVNSVNHKYIIAHITTIPSCLLCIH